MITLAGLALPATRSMAVVIVGLIITTGGFFAAHAVASSWVSARSATLGVQGPAVYLCGYYVGSSVGGTVGGLVYSTAGWPGVTDYIGAFLVTVLIIAILLRRLRPATRMAATQPSPRHARSPAPNAMNKSRAQACAAARSEPRFTWFVH